MHDACLGVAPHQQLGGAAVELDGDDARAGIEERGGDDAVAGTEVEHELAGTDARSADEAGSVSGPEEVPAARWRGHGGAPCRSRPWA